MFGLSCSMFGVCFPGVVILAAAGIFAVRAQTATNAPPAGVDYSSFRIISDRNIFNPHRYARTLRSATTTRRTVRVDEFSLVGTMTYEKGTFAFFDSGNSDLKKSVEAGDKIANYTVKRITPHAVTLDDAGKELEMKVGSQMRRENGGKWELALNGDFTAQPAETGVSTSAPPSSGDSGIEMNDTLRRLMKNREQE
jgi:hypothetical protein